MIKLRSKAYNLSILKKLLVGNKAYIPKFFYFKKEDYRKKKNNLINTIKIFQKKNDIILRSSAKSEDGIKKTQAGKYNSTILKKNDLNNTEKIIEIFLKQFKSKRDEVIVQELIKKVNYAGVIFTKDSKYNSPYYLINYDKSGRTDLITSGNKNDTKKQLVIYKNYKNKSKFGKLIYICKILEKKFNTDRLDIEFAIKKNKIYLFQVRYLPTPNLLNKRIFKASDFSSVMLNIEKKLNYLLKKNLNLTGNFTIFSNMADWNPAEMIGDKPNPLGLSLYKELITDEVWRKQRSNYGYKDVYPNVLMFSYAGSPYIDIRTDLNSFLPSTINKNYSDKIINKYLSILKKNTYLHDKIEFNLIETCYSICSKDRLKKIFNSRITNKYLNELRKLTINIFKRKLINIEENKLKIFKNNLETIDKKNISPIQKIFFLSNIIKDFGTLPFAGMARMAFISQIILLDLKKKNLISPVEFENFFNSLKLINYELSKDHHLVLKRKLSKKIFLKRYGHIRPSTYDINSLSYKENYKKYFSSQKNENQIKSKTVIRFKNKKLLNKMFLKNYKISFNFFINFAKKAIVERERSKFIFSQGVDKIFENLIKLSNEINISRSDLSYIDIKNILNFYPKLESRKLKKALLEEIKENKKEFEFLKMIKLPDIIKSKQDIYCFEESFSKINFVTTKKIIGFFEEITSNSSRKTLDGKIILIKNADPGYDYIFNYKIKGLITMYGGSNSHMAIRCLELNLPAAIGVGKLNYENILLSEKLLMDCSKEKLYTIK